MTPIVYPLGTWVRPIHPIDGYPDEPGIVEYTSNVFCNSIPDYQRVTVRWPDHPFLFMEAAAKHFVAVEQP